MAIGNFLNQRNPNYVPPTQPEPARQSIIPQQQPQDATPQRGSYGVQEYLPAATFDPNYYLQSNPDVASAIAQGNFTSPEQHFQLHGSQEGRQGVAPPEPEPAFTEADLRALAGEIDYYGDQGQGQVLDYLARNPNKVEPYVSRRQQYEPGFTYTPQTSQATTARDQALQEAISEIEGLGLNPADFQNEIEAELNKIYQSVPYGSQNASTYFQSDVVSPTLDRAQTQQRTRYTNEYDNLLPQTYSTNQLPDTLDDDVINQIIEEQYGTAYTNLDRSKQRGSLTDSGFQSALSDLANQRKAATSRLQGVGSEYLTSARGGIDDIVNEGRNAASSYTLGSSPFDANTYASRASSKAKETRTGLEGALRNEIGGEQLFDTGRSTQSGYQAQGAQNTSRNQVLDTLATREQQRKSSRGVGSQGVF